MLEELSLGGVGVGCVGGVTFAMRGRGGGSPRKQPHRLSGAQQGKLECTVIIVTIAISTSSKKLLFSSTYYVPASCKLPAHLNSFNSAAFLGGGVLLSAPFFR